MTTKKEELEEKEEKKETKKVTPKTKKAKKNTAGDANQTKSQVKSTIDQATEKLEESISSLEEKLEKSKQKRGFNFGRLFFGLLLIIFGFIYLGENLNWFHVSLGFSIIDLWPLLVIFWGLSLFNTKNWVTGLVGSVVTVGVIAVLIGMFITKGSIKEETTLEEINIRKEANSLSLNLDSTAGEIKIRGGADSMIEGAFRTSFLDLNTNTTIEDGVQIVTMKTEGDWPRFFTNRVNSLELEINNEIQSELYIKSGAAKLDIDVSDLLVSLLDVKTGASSLEIRLGDEVENMQVNVEAGASSINIILPETVGAKMVLDVGIVSKNLNGFEQEDGVYYSRNYESADKIINLNLDLGVSTLNVEWR